MIELYQFDYSPFCIKVRAILNAKDLDYRTIEILPMVTQYKVRRLSGQSQVPVLRDGGAVIVDSTEIALYLEGMYPQRGLIPEGGKRRREVLLWEDWADEAFAGTIRPLGLDSARRNPAIAAEQVVPFGNLALDLVLPKAAPFVASTLLRHYGISQQVVASARPKLGRMMDFLTEATSDDDYLVGEALTLADIAVASAAKSLDAVPDVHHHQAYGSFFEWRDRILAECFIH